MYIYHEVDAVELDEILINGLKQGSLGMKSEDEYIRLTDELLDSHLPDRLRVDGVSRRNNIYGYVAEDGEIVDIVDGQLVDVEDFVGDNNNLVLKLLIDPERCFVSDLDIYDDIKLMIENKDSFDAAAVATEYWDALLPLRDFDIGDIERPEVMVTYDIEPDDIEVCR